MKVEVAVLGSPSLISLTVSVGVRQHFNNNNNDSMAEFRSCVKVEVAVLVSPSLIIKPYGFCGRKATLNNSEASKIYIPLHFRHACVSGVHVVGLCRSV